MISENCEVGQDDNYETETSTSVVCDVAEHQEDTPDHYLEALSSECSFCGALFFRTENMICCKRGAVSLPVSAAYPDLLKALIMNNHPQSKNFIQHIRSYNTLLALGSTTIVQREGLARGAPVVVVSGQIYHRVGDVCPSDPAFGSLYFVDSGEATKKRASKGVGDGCNPRLLGQIDALLRETHPYAQMYSTLGQVVRDTRRTSGNDSVPQLGLYFHQQPGTNRKVYAAPSTSTEIGAIFRTVDGDIPPPGTVRVNLISTSNSFQIKDIPKLSPIVDALCYPLLFPNGELGWSTGLQKTIGNKRISKLEFECYRLMIRANHFNPILLSGRLAQQFIVDKYVELEGFRLNFLRTHQKELRVESYVGLQDYIARRTVVEPDGGERIGRVTILPSSFIGGARFMQQNYQDAMAIVAKYGRPSLFVTFTCNPNWREITENMGSKLLNPQDRPELIARVFDLKRRAFFEDILKFKIFGDVIAYVYVIEFQKRGLPHMHCLLTLADEYKLRNSEDVDKLICAELPAENTRLFDIIMSTMIHGPCGDRAPDSPCMVDGQCTKHYPKEFSEITKINCALPVYRRRNDGRTAIFKRNKGMCVIDNRDVVPYNPYLSMKYQSHINVEVITSVGAIKYVFKYINKGPDAAVLQLRNEVVWDEIQAFIDSRYISSGESAWRLLSFHIQDKSHTIYRLPVHLPGEREVYFEEGEEMTALQRSKLSRLEAYFELNVNDPSAREWKYCEIPLLYSFNATQHRWVRRLRKRSVIPRMYTISPKYIEKFNLRILLLHVPGAKSFNDLKSFGGTLYSTFKEAVLARNLIASDSEWFRTLEHAALVEMPGCMRKLFAYMLCFCEIGEPLSLWNEFKRFMIEDYVRKGISECQSEDCALRRIEKTLRFLGKTLRDFNLPEPTSSSGVNVTNTNDDNETSRTESSDSSLGSLNQEQRNVFNKIISAVESAALGVDRYFYLQGSGGTGKTHLYNTLLEYCEERHIPTLAVAFTGIAALLLRNGRTVHSTFRLPLHLNASSRSSITAQSQEADHLRKIRLIIWDEVSMASYHVLNIVDDLLRDVCMDPRPFGGKCILLGGDVKQLLPVASGRVEQIELFFTNYRFWRVFQVVHLMTNMRVNAGGEDFTRWLEDLGRGTTNTQIVKDKDTKDGDFVNLPDRCLTVDVVREIYGQLHALTPQQLAQRAILCPKNEHCNLLNDKILESFPGKTFVIHSNDSVASGDEDEVANFPEEYLNSITPSGMPHHKLKLKVGVPVILLRNLCLEDGLINGTRLLVLAVTDMLITAEIVTGRFCGRRVLIPRMDLTSSDQNLPFVLKRRQFPLKLCFALTINKAQGQTFERVGIYLASPVFSHGQLYVAFSRARSWDSVKVEVVKTKHQGYLLKSSKKVFTKNIVFGNILNSIQNE
ncbi:uncharacterized protein LOC123317775 [Coccinella septempunctata]|uniref:uncharacterized protein LOC123317775 n=1 Tax=Coccinella septempunctata TaxID=41139 RepID=UPI001D088E59|nr:uncharacterized protein LOC123317775 [Coccinella septempunctata]